MQDDDATTEEEQRALEERILAAQQNREPADWAVREERPVRASDLVDMKDPYGIDPQEILDRIIKAQLYDAWLHTFRDKMWRDILANQPLSDDKDRWPKPNGVYP